MASFFKDNKLVSILLIVSLLLIALLTYFLLTYYLELRDLRQTEESLKNDIEELGGEVDLQKLSAQKQLALTSHEEAEEMAQLMEEDVKLASEFFTPAFSWKSADEYDEIRRIYVELLGEDNSFVELFLLENKRDNLANEADSYIDRLNLTVELEEIEIVPLRAAKNDIHYIAFITYQSKTDDVPEDKASRASKSAIVQFIISGEIDEREITDIEAWTGFST
ncbi:MAG TPA: hypothetical protein VFF20_00045 [Pseudogracilibacillus sp.]|nr:hypothetical protein [Pseudogracilibacillus sp.]